MWCYHNDRPHMTLGDFIPKQRLAMAARLYFWLLRNMRGFVVERGRMRRSGVAKAGPGMVTSFSARLAWLPSGLLAERCAGRRCRAIGGMLWPVRFCPI